MLPRRISRLCGVASLAAGLLFPISLMIHPAKEDVASILSQTPRLLASHFLTTLALIFLLLGTVGLYARQADELGDIGLSAFLLSFSGSLLLGVSGNYGFIAPALAAHAPNMLAEINAYPPVIALNGLMILSLNFGFALFGMTTARDGVFPRWEGWLMAIGLPIFFGGAMLALGGLPASVTSITWLISLSGATIFGLGLIWSGYTLWSEASVAIQQPAALMQKP